MASSDIVVIKNVDDWSLAGSSSLRREGSDQVLQHGYTSHKNSGSDDDAWHEVSDCVERNYIG